MRLKRILIGIIDISDRAKPLKNRRRLSHGAPASAQLLTTCKAGAWYTRGMQNDIPHEKIQGQGRERVTAIMRLPSHIFTKLREVGVSDRELTLATGLSRQTLARACAGQARVIGISKGGFQRLLTFAEQKLADLEDEVDRARQSPSA